MTNQTIRDYVQHKPGCRYQLTGAQLFHNSALVADGQPPLHIPKCTCGLDQALSASPDPQAIHALIAQWRDEAECHEKTRAEGVSERGRVANGAYAQVLRECADQLSTLLPPQPSSESEKNKT